MSLDAILKFEHAGIYQSDNLILTDVSLTINKGEFYYLIGKVGSGKTSLIKTINAELPLNEGEGMACGFNLKKIRRKQIPYLRRRLGIVFQDFQLMADRNIYQNLLFVLRATGWKNKTEINQRISDVLDKVNLSSKENQMPHQLSGGEQQRVVIARALLNNPDIILADEPTGNLDPDTSEEIMQVLFEISSTGRAVIMATHNYNLLKKYPANTLKCDNKKVYKVEEATEIDFSSLM